MASTAGIDLKRGRPTPSIGTTEAKLQQRKLDALRRGVHKVKDATSLPYGIHVIGVGAAGAGVVERMLREAPSDLLSVEGSRLSVLVVDIGDDALAGVHGAAARFASEAAHIEAVSLKIPTPEALSETMRDYRARLELEYPLLQGSPSFSPWIDGDVSLKAEGSVPRALAKAIYGAAYYEGERLMLGALKRFAVSTNATRGDAVVCIVFGLGGGTGSGIAVDLARHLSTGQFGRRVLITGVGIAPCDGDSAESRSGALFPVISELDALCDESQNRGVVQACGELYKNPFTAGFLLVPQQPTFAKTGSLSETHKVVDGQLASLLTLRHGANLWEVLRLLNWVAAPSTQHSAARTPWGAKWMHVLAFGDMEGSPAEGAAALMATLGIHSDYLPEFLEMRAAEDGEAAKGWALALDQTFNPEATATVAAGGAHGMIQFVLPRVSKTDLAMFYDARDLYDEMPLPQRVLAHSLLLERGIVLCEPSSLVEGLAGASLNATDAWVGVEFATLRGPSRNIVDGSEGELHAA